MATFSDLPSELVAEIVFYTFLMDQVNRPINPEPQRYRRHSYTPSLDENDVAPHLTSHAVSKITSKSFTENLWTKVEKCTQFNDQPEKISALVPLLIKDSTLADYVRSVSLVCGGSQPLPAHHDQPRTMQMSRRYYADMEHIGFEIATKILQTLAQTPGTSELQMEKRMSTWFTDLVLSVFLDQLSNLESFKMVSGDMYCLKYLFRHTTYFVNRKIPMGLKRLQEFSFVCSGHHSLMEEVNGYEVLPIFTLPNIRRIHLSLLGHGRTQGYETYFRSYYGKSTVKELEFNSAAFGKRQLNVFLQLPAALESFKFKGPKKVVLPREKFTDSITASEMGSLLSLQAGSLKTVDMEQIDGDPVGIPFPRNLWKEFPCLQHLGVP
ncbi:hypothetical protein B0J14DRAFT_686211 [Halenospora varia]|nr:hypothetical protein B0J14DRAFT_686211 [Halenospora varia]